MSQPLKLYVGSGTDSRQGYINCDIRPLPGVDLVCPAWDIPLYARELTAIYSRHTLEHLTDQELRLTLDRWFDALATGGVVEIIVPNIRFHIRQWLEADWQKEGIPFTKSNERWAFAGFFGWQNDCDPLDPHYNPSYWDVHKSGFDESRIRYLLENSGFAAIETEIQDQCHLFARATKLARKRERQVAPRIEAIRADHRARYEFAKNRIRCAGRVGDFACGVGYGASILSQSDCVEFVYALDIDQGSIDYARQYYQNPRIDFRVGDIQELNLDPESLTAITCFETIEHLRDPARFLAKARKALRPGGLLFCSTPNEDVFPLSQANNPYHFRHYRPDDFLTLLADSGFDIAEKLTQRDRDSGEILPGWSGLYNIAVATRSQVLDNRGSTRHK